MLPDPERAGGRARAKGLTAATRDAIDGRPEVS